MVPPESKPVKPVDTEFASPRGAALDPNGAGHAQTSSAPRDEFDEAVLRGVVAIDIPREVIARFSGTLILNELPERLPEVVFARDRQFRDDDDE